MTDFLKKSLENAEALKKDYGAGLKSYFKLLIARALVKFLRKVEYSKKFFIAAIKKKYIIYIGRTRVI